MTRQYATEYGKSAGEAWERLRNNAHFYGDYKSVLETKAFQFCEEPDGIDFLGLGKLIDLEIKDPETAICIKSNEDDAFIFAWLA